MTAYLPFFRALIAVAVSTVVKAGRNLARANLTGADLADADLRGADLSDASLRGANLSDADLRGADLSDANLSGVSLRGADLRGADLRGANLRDANLAGADLSDADLRGANLSYANLSGADLAHADLADANLAGADLSGANLSGANLSGTCLDPQAEIPVVTDAEITAAGLSIDGARIYGWRTARSQHVDSTVYEPGTIHRAPWFSVAGTECHPGIYLAGLKWLRREYPGAALVRVSCRRCDLHRAGTKWRAREIRVESEETP